MGKNMKGYKIDFRTNTIIMNYTFAAAAEEYGTAEYNLLRNILADFPQMKREVQKGRNQKSPNKNKNLTYENMEKYIKAHADAEELLKIFETVKLMSKTQSSPYKFVKDWFVKQFPNYKVIPTAREGKMFVLPLQPKAEDTAAAAKIEIA